MDSKDKLTPHLLELIARIREDLAAHGGDWTRPGFQALAVHRFGNFRMHIKSTPVRAPLSITYRALFRFIRNVYGIELPYTAIMGRNIVIEHQGCIVIHGDASVGDETVIRQGVTIGNKNLDAPSDAPIIGRGVNIGAGAKILGKVTVGDNATIGANAVVVRDVEAETTVTGIPATPSSTKNSSDP